MARDPRKNPCTGDTLIRSDGTLALYVLASNLRDDWVLYRVFAPSTRLNAEYKKALANWREISEAYLEDGAHWQVSSTADIFTKRDPRNDPREGDMMIHYKGHGLRVYRTAEWTVFAETVMPSGKLEIVAKSLTDWQKFDWSDYTPVRRSSKRVPTAPEGGRTGTFRCNNSAVNPLTKANIGDIAYFEDDQTVGSKPVGTSSTGVMADIDNVGVWVAVSGHFDKSTSYDHSHPPERGEKSSASTETCGHTGREPVSYIAPELVACLSPNVVIELLAVQTISEVRATIKATDIAAAENAEARLRKKIRDWPFCPYAGRNVQLMILFRDNADGCYAHAHWYCSHCHPSGITPQSKLTYRYGEV
jgi:hypothetical protein